MSLSPRVPIQKHQHILIVMLLKCYFIINFYLITMYKFTDIWPNLNFLPRHRCSPDHIIHKCRYYWSIIKLTEFQNTFCKTQVISEREKRLDCFVFLILSFLCSIYAFVSASFLNRPLIVTVIQSNPLNFYLNELAELFINKFSERNKLYQSLLLIRAQYTL